MSAPQTPTGAEPKHTPGPSHLSVLVHAAMDYIPRDGEVERDLREALEDALADDRAQRDALAVAIAAYCEDRKAPDLLAECERLRAERDDIQRTLKKCFDIRMGLLAERDALKAQVAALKAALRGLLWLSDDIELELERTGAINDSGLSPASETEQYRIARAALAEVAP